MIFEYNATGYVESEEFETALRLEYGIECEYEYHDDYFVVVWYE